MDWGLFDKNAGENMLLREEMVYSSSVSSTIIFIFIAIVRDFAFSITYRLITILESSRTLYCDLFG